MRELLRSFQAPVGRSRFLFSARIAGDGYSLRRVLVRKILTVDHLAPSYRNAYAHRMAGYSTNPASPRNALLGATMKGLRRIKGTPHHQKDPLLTRDIRQIVTAGRGLLGIRNSALLSIGFAGAFRRAELVSLHCSDISWSSGGVTVEIRRSKTDGIAEGRAIGIPSGADGHPDEALCIGHKLRCIRMRFVTIKHIRNGFALVRG